VEVALKMGAEVVIAVNVLPEFGLRKKPNPKVKTKILPLKASGTFNKINANIINKRISEFVKTKVKSIEVVNRIANIFQEKIKVEKVRGPNAFNILLQTISIMEYEIVKLRLKSADIIIKPEVSHIKPVQFYRAKECILEGERKTEEILARIKRRIK
jgi:predicted acylesterase/phospholipase RssA